MCLELGLSKSTLSDMKNGRTKGVSIPTAQKIAGYFDISVDELYGIEDKKEKPTVKDDGLTDSQRKLIEFAEGMTDDQIEALIQMSKAFLGRK
jgi:transcriptional regulator with XRE-family HTH domain